MLIVFQRGSRSAQYAKVSVTSRIDGRGGKMYVPRAAYSLRMSFWIVPPSVSAAMPLRSAASSYSSRSTDAGALIVIEVVTSSCGMPRMSSSMSSRESMATPTLPTSPCASGSSLS